ncbi:MAG TPA: hypothetical protein VLH60_07410, partial [Sedimentisphaerales bacterium]|nr:hypothetical protein [Sedimentisphaerales bacterium]
MDGNGINRDDIVGTTDYLEAITVFKATKNFLFVVTLFGLVLMLASFFVANSQYASFEGTIAAQRAASEDVLARGIGELAAKAISHVEEVTAATEQHGPNLPRSAAMTRPVGTADDAAHAATEPADANEAAEAQQVPPFRIKFQWIAWVLRVGSFAGIITTTLYSMMLAFCLTISLVGRLGGINHIAR